MKRIEELQNDIMRLREDFGVYTRRFLEDCEDTLIDNEKVTKEDIMEWALGLTIEDLKEDASDGILDIYGDMFSTIAEDVANNYDANDVTYYKWRTHLLDTYVRYVANDIDIDFAGISDLIDTMIEINGLKENAQQVINDLEDLLDKIKESIIEIEYIDDIEDYCDVSRYDLEDLCDRVEEYIEGLVCEVEENNE